jgi:hypothetical protein
MDRNIDNGDDPRVVNDFLKTTEDEGKMTMYDDSLIWQLLFDVQGGVLVASQHTRVFHLQKTQSYGLTALMNQQTNT